MRPLLSLITIAVVAAAAMAGGEAKAAAAPQITLVECAKHPGLFDLVYIKNHGDAPQDLTGWQLRSDPEGSEQMSLGAAGVLDPAEEIIIAAGAHGVNLPNENLYLWTNLEVLRDEGDPPDYAKLFDASGTQVSGLDCLNRPLGSGAPAPAPAPAPVPVQPAAQPQAAAQPADQDAGATAPRQAAEVKAVPNTGGEPLGAVDSDSIAWLGLVSIVAGTAMIGASTIGARERVRITSIEGESGVLPGKGARTRPGRHRGDQS